ncbi:MinD/ParA family protein [Clostridium vincentii]|uniref:Flagellum site-determining protein YlxH n=1 Tax=Clostridium vincentii TaxID=52704 RepID=A0A2T0BJA5_9CLOT|nr:MinD/ParA family protein [Clostridium vincentii]PRR83964.1 Flagellum site-determining protein YlxH [Clostridium vincentii]
MLDQAERLRRLVNDKDEINPKNKAKIITVTSGKGGVGKSNFVVNLGITLQKKGKRVLIFDADIGMGNDDVLMGIYPRYNIFDLIRGRDLDEILVQGPEGVMLLAGGSGLNQVEDLQSHERDAFLGKLESLDGFDYILMDTGAGINRSVLAFIACSEELIIIITPEPTSLTDAYSLVKATDHFKIKSKAKIVVNKAFTKAEGNQTFNKFKTAVNRFLTVEVSYLGCILDDRKLVQGVRDQVPFVISYPHSDASKGIEEISKTLLGEDSKMRIGAQGVFKKLFNIFS